MSKPRTKLSPEQIQRIKLLRSQGASYGKISALLGISKDTAWRYGRVNAIVKHPRFSDERTIQIAESIPSIQGISELSSELKSIREGLEQLRSRVESLERELSQQQHRFRQLEQGIMSAFRFTGDLGKALVEVMDMMPEPIRRMGLERIIASLEKARSS